VCKPINIGSNTDPYQPIEKKWRHRDQERDCTKMHIFGGSMDASWYQ